MPLETTITVQNAKKVPARAAVVARLIASDRLADSGLDKQLLGRLTFAGNVGQTLVMPGEGRSATVLVGAGKAAEITTNVLRRVGAAVAKAASGFPSLVIDHGPLTATLDDPAGVTQALTEGVMLGGYRFDRHRGESKPHLERVTLVGVGDRGEAKGMARGRAVAAAVCFARDLVNEPGGTLVPAEFAARVVSAAEEVGVDTTVWGREQIEAERLGGVMAVNQGSGHGPRFVRLDYRPDGSTGHVALVGKGITFDSGGLSIKPSDSMMTMKCDMAGAAAVVATMLALPSLGLPIAVSAYAPLTDNMTGDFAQRPGDVFTARNGKTVEVLNTDAEGRLVLADALSVASESEPDLIVDLATLTGACMVALGDKVAGVLSNDDGLRDEVLAASTAADEAMWSLPLVEDYRKLLESGIADLKNIGGRYGGAITAGLFLREFVGEGIPWAHIDIAGPAFAEDAPADGPKGGTGFGVRTLLAFLEARAAAQAAGANSSPETA